MPLQCFKAFKMISFLLGNMIVFIRYHGIVLNVVCSLERVMFIRFSDNITFLLLEIICTNDKRLKSLTLLHLVYFDALSS